MSWLVGREGGPVPVEMESINCKEVLIWYHSDGEGRSIHVRPVVIVV